MLEAAAQLGDFLGAQVTAVGHAPPKRTLVIGAGVAGLSAIAAARSLGAEVTAFDTRAATREQVESLGASFLTVELDESGEGGGGYARKMSDAFIEAEMDLFRSIAPKTDIVITTALVPGARAPMLLPRDVVAALPPGAVVVDMAAEQGGNCELTEPGAVVEHPVPGGTVRVVGYTDLPSRMPRIATRLFASAVANLIEELYTTGVEPPALDLDDTMVRAMTAVYRGEVLGPAPIADPAPAAPAGTRAAPAPAAAAARDRAVAAAAPPASGSPAGRAGLVLLVAALAAAGLLGLSLVAPASFVEHMTVFVLACFVGWHVVWAVKPALHTPLMSVTNAISGIIVVGGILQAATGRLDAAAILGAAAVLLATINVAGGFLVTQRMLAMFKRSPA